MRHSIFCSSVHPVRRRIALALVISLVLVLAAALAAGCWRSTQFQCDDDTDCGAAGGRCEGVGFCSVPDPTCTGSLRRFSDSAGRLAGTCVDPVAVGAR